jgi:catechol 2,3-dioxygenase-like lactoylglutathione lyase family enzyme
VPARPEAEWVGIDHVQLAISTGGELLARQFYVDQLGLREVPKPSLLAVRGGCWFEAGGVRLHVGVDPDFHPALKAHPALAVRDVRGLVVRRCLDVVWSDEVPGTVRCHLLDPFGNRLELVEAS